MAIVFTYKATSKPSGVAKIKRFMEEYPNMMNKKFEQNKLTKEVKIFLQSLL